MTAASELVCLHVSGALLPRYMLLLLDDRSPIAFGVGGLLKNPTLLLLNILALAEEGEAPAPSNGEPKFGGESSLEPSLSSAPITNCPADRFAIAQAAFK